MAAPVTPGKIQLHRQSRQLELHFGEESWRLDAEYLRVHSPSAEVRGHGRAILQTGKKNVGIKQIEKAGNYALKITFDDGHDTGIYTWGYLHDLCVNREAYWDSYLQALEQVGASRDPDVGVVRLV